MIRFIVHGSMRKIRNIRDFKEFFFVIHTHMDQFQQKVILNIKAMVSSQIHLQTALHSVKWKNGRWKLIECYAYTITHLDKPIFHNF